MKSGFLAFALSIVSLLAGCDRAPMSQPEQPDIAATSLAPQIGPAKLKAAMAAIRAEPRVIDLVYDPEAVVQWTIAVKDDGSLRFGLAEYFCLRLSELGARQELTHVRIVDYTRFIASQGDARGASLGQVDCGTSRHLSP